MDYNITTYEFLFFRLLNRLYEESKTVNLCLSGGCAYIMELQMEKF